jgi:hypothetical protein
VAGDVTYVANTDYVVKRSGILILDAGAIANAQTIHVDYTKKAGNVVQALTDSAKEWKLYFDGLNEAQSGKAVAITIHRFKFGPPRGIGFIADDFAGMETTGDALADTAISGAGLSQYFLAEMVN